MLLTPGRKEGKLGNIIIMMYSMADFSTFCHYIDLKCPKSGLKFVKYYDLKWNFELGGLLNDQGKRVYFNKFPCPPTPQ